MSDVAHVFGDDGLCSGCGQKQCSAAFWKKLAELLGTTAPEGTVGIRLRGDGAAFITEATQEK